MSGAKKQIKKENQRHSTGNEWTHLTLVDSLPFFTRPSLQEKSLPLLSGLNNIILELNLETRQGGWLFNLCCLWQRVYSSICTRYKDVGNTWGFCDLMPPIGSVSHVSTVLDLYVPVVASVRNI